MVHFDRHHDLPALSFRAGPHRRAFYRPGGHHTVYRRAVLRLHLLLHLRTLLHKRLSRLRHRVRTCRCPGFLLLTFHLSRFSLLPIAIAKIRRPVSLTLRDLVAHSLLPVLLTLVAMVIALIEGQIDVSHRVWLKTLLEFALPWLIAQSAFGSFSALSLFFTLVFTLVYRGLLGLSAAREDRWIVWNNLAQLVAALVLFANNAPAVAGLIALGLLAQVLWQSRYRVNRDGRAYVQRVQSYVLVAMLATSLALWF